VELERVDDPNRETKRSGSPSGEPQGNSKVDFGQEEGGYAMRLDGLSISRNPYLFHLWSIRKKEQVRRDERLAERMRIAHALHDTVLQTFQSAFLQLHVAADQLPPNSPTKLQLRKVLELMERATEEFRRAVRGLRSSEGESNDLEESFLRIPQELGTQEQIALRILVLGSPRQLNPVVRDEIYHIGREALVNALRHSRASSVEVELEYAPRRFRLVVRDNGCGIGSEVLRSGREGHWGLSGMRERAQKIGGTLRTWSREAAGTEIELSVPNSTAFGSGKRRPAS
jgi:signal transduction histidine kinase